MSFSIIVINSVIYFVPTIIQIVRQYYIYIIYLFRIVNNIKKKMDNKQHILKFGSPVKDFLNMPNPKTIN